ncbi:MAG: flagellar protein [Lachnospiraceae bacterium]
MDVRNCRDCGRLFNYINGQPICPSCKDELEKKFAQVKVYIRSNPTATIQMVAEENEVSTRQIKQWVREERLCFTDDSVITVECENCGAPIRTGRYCTDCIGKMQNNLNSALDRPKVQETKKQVRDREKMRFLDQN